jgi:hypothetical protein
MTTKAKKILALAKKINARIAAKSDGTLFGVMSIICADNKEATVLNYTNSVISKRENFGYFDKQGEI